VSDQSASIDEARLDVLRLQPRITIHDGLRAVPRGEHSVDVLYGKPPTRIIGLPPKIFGST
jgi:hypothetical protein